jgi:hypothetical protein
VIPLIHELTLGPAPLRGLIEEFLLTFRILRVEKIEFRTGTAN